MPRTFSGGYAIVKIKVFTDQTVYEREDETDWDDNLKNRLPNAYALAGKMIAEVINIITVRHPNFGLSHHYPIPEIKEIVWSIYNPRSINGPKLLKSKRYTELRKGDPPVAFMTPLPRVIDNALEIYHEARNETQPDDPTHQELLETQPTLPLIFD